MRAYEAAKRALDVAAAGCGLVVLAPLLLVIGAAVKLSSRGPVLYFGRRTGRHGRPFDIWKFRTMQPDAERLGTTTAPGDPRVTPVGKVLRQYKLDELPQLVNVLRGEMSLVGPRPEVAEHTDAYTAEEQAILSVRPGITDFASIRFADLARELGPVDPHGEYLRRVRGQKNQLRLEYVRRRSLATDLSILLATAGLLVRRVLGRRG